MIARGVDTSDLATKKDFIALKAKVYKLDVIKFVNVPTNFNNFRTKVDDLDVGKRKTVTVDLKKINDKVDNEKYKRFLKIVKNTKCNMLKTEVNSFEKKIPDATTLIHTNQYNTD